MDEDLPIEASREQCTRTAVKERRAAVKHSKTQMLTSTFFRLSPFHSCLRSPSFLGRDNSKESLCCACRKSGVTAIKMVPGCSSRLCVKIDRNYFSFRSTYRAHLQSGKRLRVGDKLRWFRCLLEEPRMLQSATHLPQGTVPSTFMS